MALTHKFYDQSNLGNILIFEDNQSINSQHLSLGINFLKKHLDQKGIGPGSKIILCLTSSKLFCEYFFSAWEVGACVIPLSPQLTKTEIDFLVGKIKPSLIIYSNGKEEFLNNHSKTEINNALILYTSGSSGTPKGVVLTKEALANKINLYRVNLPIEHFSNTLCMLPLNFGHGLISNFLLPILTGHQVVLAPASRLDIYSNLGEIIDNFGITCFSSVPSILKIATNFGNSPKNKSLKKIFCASAPLDFSTWNKTFEWSSGVRVNNMYGMTELASWIAGDQQIKDPIYQENTFDYPWEAEIKILKEAADDEYGEILVKSNSMMSEYYEDIENTHKALQDGWFKTGDIGKVSSKRIHLMGRLDDMINLGGIKIYPEEVNRIIRQHPKVLDCFTTGLKIKDNESDHAIGCLIVPVQNQSINILEIQEICKEHLSSYKIPTQFKILDKMPTNERGKIDRTFIKNIFRPKIKE
ncbi:MAG: class I adenylate-forming enzyme family protein [Bacteriovorax sp.]|nr:class I adenylate-forming enzyme family protein [Bacteriovorax sp.]